MTSALVALLAGVLAVTLAVHFGTIFLAAIRALPRFGAAREGATDQPMISLVRPICGVDPFDRETLGSSFKQDYPGYELLFCSASEGDPAVALVRELIEAHPDVPARVLIGDDPISGNPKLNNVVKGYREAASDWVVFTDSNLLLPPDYLARLMATWQDDTGLVTAPPMGARPGNFWGSVECAVLNTSQGRWQLAADTLGFGFAQGKTLFWRRDVLEAGGSLPALGLNLAEDVASTKLVRGQGLRVRLTPQLFAQPIGEKTPREVWARHLRWSRVRRDGFPLIFVAEILQGPAMPFLALAVLALMGMVSGWSLLALAVLWYGAELGLAAIHGWPHGPRDLAAMLVRDAMLPALWVATFAARGFSWRGTAMEAGGGLPGAAE